MTTHSVQFAGADKAKFVSSVATYLAEGLRRAERCIVAAVPEHAELFVKALGEAGLDCGAAERNGCLVLINARQIAKALLLEGKPDRSVFDHLIGRVVRDTDRTRFSGLRVYGEIVGVYWAQGQRTAALQVEQFWNTLMQERQFMLYCGYPIDPFEAGFNADEVHDILCAHEQTVCGVDATRVERAIADAMDTVLGEHANFVREVMRRQAHPAWGEMPSPEATILWLRKNLPAYADAILADVARNYPAFPD